MKQCCIILIIAREKIYSTGEGGFLIYSLSRRRHFKVFSVTLRVSTRGNVRRKIGGKYGACDS